MNGKFLFQFLLHLPPCSARRAESTLRGKVSLLIRYYSAVDIVVKYGRADASTLANVCGAELRGQQFGNYVPGDCERLGHEAAEKAKSELGIK